MVNQAVASVSLSQSLSSAGPEAAGGARRVTAALRSLHAFPAAGGGGAAPEPRPAPGCGLSAGRWAAEGAQRQRLGAAPGLRQLGRGWMRGAGGRSSAGAPGPEETGSARRVLRRGSISGQQTAGKVSLSSPSCL